MHCVDRIGLGLLFVYVVLLLVGAVGWCSNLLHLFKAEALWPLTGELILRVVGVFLFPLGAVLGFL